MRCLRSCRAAIDLRGDAARIRNRRPNTADPPGRDPWNACLAVYPRGNIRQRQPALLPNSSCTAEEGGVPRFELDRLTSYDEQSLLAEVRRVAGLVSGETLTEALFNEHARVHSTTIRKRFGSWRDVLTAAGLPDRYDGRTAAKNREHVLSEIRRIANELGKRELRRREFTEKSGITDRPVRRLFGSWRHALAAAQLEQVPLGKRYTDDECFENLLAVWTHYGRPPRHSEMAKPPSVVGAKAYVRRWGAWRKALAAFVERVKVKS